MNRFKQHIPGFVDFDKPAEFYFKDIEELLNNEILKNAKNIPEFYQFSLSDNLLMAEYLKGKKWHVLGYIENPEEIDLPQWSMPSN